MAVENEALVLEQLQPHIRMTICRRYLKYGIPLEDTMQEANIAALRAIRLWSPDKGANLKTTVSVYVHNHIRRFLAERFAVSVPQRKWFAGREVRDMQWLDEPLRGDTGECLYDVLFDKSANQEGQLDDAERRHMVHQALRQLTPRERLILDERFGEDKTLATIGKEVGISRERVRQIEVKALTKLRKSLACLEAA